MPLKPNIFLLPLLLLASLFHAQTTYTPKGIDKLSAKADSYLAELNFRESLRYSREALKQSIAIKDNYRIAYAYNCIAGNYDELSENDKAIYYYNKGLTYANKTDNDTLKNWLNNNLGNMYFFEKKQYEKGIAYYEASIHYSEKTADTSQMLFTKLNISWAYFDIGLYDQGRPYLQFVNKNFSKFGRKNLRAARLLLNGMLESHDRHDKSAGAYFRMAIDTAKATKERLDLSYSYEEYSKFLAKTGDHKSAYYYLQQFGKIKDEVYDSEKLKRAASEGLNLELDEYKRAVDRIAAENEVQALSLRKSQIIVILFIVSLLALTLLVYILYKNVNFKKKTNAELLQANRDLVAAKEKAEEAARLKTQFVSTISHELRTPLYGVVGITDMISDEHKELAKSPHLNSLRFSAKYLLSLVNDILQINKIEEKRVVLENHVFNISDEISTIKDSLKFIANRNRNEIETEIDPAIPETLIGDKLRLSQIFMNLVSNALKFTSDGKVTISASLVKNIGDKFHIKFVVKDNGIGIAEEDQEKIFDKFVQIERKENDYQGTGLGLSIVKKLIELFDSQISLTSDVNRGTEFDFTIAFEHNSHKTQEIINNIEVDLSTAASHDVLVVEDNKINQMVTRKILQNNGYHCKVVDDGLSAIEMLRKKKFDIVLMDINMPIINGFETTRRIRLFDMETPIVALTAFDKEEITEEAISAGMNDIIIKPFESVKLFQVISAQISKRREAEGSGVE
ncbi:response regulator [Flavobacterium sp.]|uniref:tetratricopeptide repeat-containing hybrid sensor histidine kinase/response regulator n=1 Tax=Flavobacterium sp. TaxID=239 RepID=UPI0011F84447|nr:response regulator [Flavobacterium sp.]RZJ72863.1 MAG: response regulator [Flavobacterium sp.]